VQYLQVLFSDYSGRGGYLIKGLRNRAFWNS
jgi:hypothetical protein